MLAAGRPLTVDQLKALFDGRSAPDNKEIRAAVDALNEDYGQRGIEVVEVASGYRIQVRPSMTDRLQKLWEERPPRYSRALFETLALIAYRQPITRGEIEEVRGVAVSSNIVRSLMERDWVRVVGHRDVPGRPAMFGTTKSFLDYFGLKKLDDLPELTDLADWESLRVQLDLPEVEDGGTTGAEVPSVVAELPSIDTDAAATTAEGGQAEEVAEVVDDAADDARAPEQPTDDATSGSGSRSAADGAALVGVSVERVGDAPDMQALEAETIEEELVVSEWPEPQNPEADAALDEDDLGDGKDASVRG